MDRRMMALLVSYTFASLAHFVHNAEFLNDYPNMPDWLSRGEVYVTWIAIAALGLVGYVLVRLGFRNPGLIAIAIYGLLGLHGLTHYWLAPIADHTFNMNFTIWLGGITGVLLAVNAISTLSAPRPPHQGMHMPGNR